jgi:hypothetical protein
MNLNAQEDGAEEQVVEEGLQLMQEENCPTTKPTSMDA